MPTRFHQFANVRARFQLKGEMATFTGWTESYGGGYVSVWMAASSEFKQGDELHMELFGVEKNLAFTAVIEGFVDERPSSFVDPYESSTEICFSLRLTCPVTELAAKEDARFLLRAYRARARLRDETLDIEILDASCFGVGLKMPIRPRIGDPVEVILNKAGRLLSATGRVRYARNDIHSPGQFRVGLRIETVPTEDRIQWLALLEAA